MGRVEPAAPGRRSDQGLDLRRGGVHPGGIDESGGEADRAGVERVLDRADHRRELLVGRRSRVGADDRCPDRALADEERDVQAERLLGDAIEVLPERPPSGDEPVRAQQQRRRSRGRCR